MMTNGNAEFGSTLESLGLGREWKWDKGAWWQFASLPIDVRVTTRRMIELGARFVAITAIERANKQIRLDYQWDLNGKLLCFVCSTHENQIATIADLCPAADWVERETHEYFAVTFTGRETTAPLMMRVGDVLGINLHKEITQ